jgi:hypothetical protein
MRGRTSGSVSKAAARRRMLVNLDDHHAEGLQVLYERRSAAP